MALAAKNMDRSRRAVVGAAACCLIAHALLATGCSSPRSFPSPSGDQGLSANSPPLPQVITDALKYAHHEIAPKTALIFNLPKEMNEPAWGTYERLMSPAKPMCPGDTGVWTVELARIDGSRAQVEIQYPSRDGFYQRVTVHMTGATAGVGYRPEYLQYWRVPVKDPVCNTPASVQERNCGKAAGVPQPSSGAVAAPSQVPPAKASSAVPSSSSKTEDPSK